MPVRVIMHVDMDAFYSSVEQRENPELRGKPVIVGADPKGGSGRGVVVACSYEARSLGVHSAQPISQAYRLCPQGIYLRPNYQRYEDASENAMQVLRQHAALFEQISIDEAFLDLTGKIQNFEEAESLANRIKEDVHSETQLTCSIGLAPNKSIAKIASDFKKPNGLTVVPPEQVREFLASLPVSKISGIGKKSAELLKNLDIITIGQLASTHPSKLTDVFGKYGTRLWQVANGVDDEEVITTYSTRSISSETTFEEDTADLEKVSKAFSSLIDDIHARVLSQKTLFRTVGIKVRLEDFSTFTREKTYSRHTDQKAIMEEYVHTLFDEFENSQRRFRLIGVRVSNLTKVDSDQETILSWANSQG